MAYLSKQQVADIIKKAPPGTTPAGIVASLRQNGHVLEGYSQTETLQQKTGAAATPQEIRADIGIGLGSLTAAEQKSKEANRPLVAARLDDSGLKAGAKAAVNLPSSAFNLARNIGTAVFNPIDTAKGLFNIGLGGIQKLIPGEQVAEADFDGFKQLMAERYGSLDSLQLTATNDPFGFGTDIVGGVTAAGRGLLRGAAREATESAAQTAATRATSIVTAPITKPIQSIKNKAGQIAVSRMDKALQLNPSDTRRITAPTVLNGKTPSEWLVERGIAGGRDQIIEKLTDISTQSKTAKDTALAGISNTYRIAGKKADIPQARQALEVIKKQYDGIPGNEQLVRQIDDILGQKQLTLSQLDKVKSLIDRNLQLFKVSGDLKAGALAKGLGNIRSEIKTFIEKQAAKNGVDNVAALNKDTQVATEIRKAILKKEAALANNRTISLTDIIVGVGIGGGVDLGTGAAAVVAKKVFESPKFQTNLARQLNKLSEVEVTALERALALGAPTPEYIAIMQRVIDAAINAGEVDIPQTIQEDVPVTPETNFNGLRNVPSF